MSVTRRDALIAVLLASVTPLVNDHALGADTPDAAQARTWDLALERLPHFNLSLCREFRLREPSELLGVLLSLADEMEGYRATGLEYPYLAAMYDLADGGIASLLIYLPGENDGAEPNCLRVWEHESYPTISVRYLQPRLAKALTWNEDRVRERQD